MRQCVCSGFRHAIYQGRNSNAVQPTNQPCRAKTKTKKTYMKKNKSLQVVCSMCSVMLMKKKGNVVTEPKGMSACGLASDERWWCAAHTSHSPLASFNSAPGTPGGGGAASALFDKQGSRLLSVRTSTIRGPVSAKGQGRPDAEQSSPSWAAKRDCADVCAVQERRQPCV